MPWNASIVDSQILAVHAALVPSGAGGEVVLFGGDEHWSAQQESAGGGLFKKTRVYDVQSHSIVAAAVPSPDSDVFCSHHAFAADGRLLIGGGTSKWPEGGDAHTHPLDFLGHRRCWLYNARGRQWVEASRMNKNPDQPDEENSGGRWYPGLLTLANGDVAAFFGHLMQGDSRHRNTLPERYSEAGNVWFNLPKEMAYPIEPGDGVRFLFFARSFVLPDGTVFFATPMPVDYATASGGDGTYFSTRYNPETGDYVGHKIPEPGFGGYLDWSRPAVLLPLLPEEDYRPRVLFCGDTGAIKIDLGVDTPAWENTAARDASVSARTRQYSNAAILPTGEVCLVGGVNVVEPEDPVLQPEIYDPGINWTNGDYSNPDSWSVKEPGTHTRNYHSVALLLPNGKVWVAGGNTNGQPGDPDGNVDVGGVTKKRGIKRIELYEPDYIAVPNRIQLTQSPRVVTYGEQFEIEIDRPASNVQRVALIRNGSATHSTNNDQRYVGVHIDARSGNTLQLTAPPSGNVAPPGYYMLWVVDNSGRPCQQAAFVRVAYLGCEVITDRSTFSQEEVESLGGGGQATFTNALYVNFDGFLDAELTASPDFALTWDDTAASVSNSDLTLVPVGRWLEVSPADPDIPQRITYPFHVRFFNTNPYTGFTDTRRVRVTFTLGHHTCTQTLDLTKAPNPYMVDIDPARQNPHWLSTDVRVFKVAAGDVKFGSVTQSSGANAPYDFIKAVLDMFNHATNDLSHPFLSLTPDQASSALDLAADDSIFNYAVAKVRYRATTTTASRVKVFFRAFNSVGTALEYNKETTYRHNGPGTNTVPLLGRAGEVVSIPFFLSPRVETVQGQPGEATMTAQPLDPNYEIKDIAPTGGENVAYFGCWLDINRTKKRFPISPGATDDGPWPEASCKSIQELIRGRHQCLVAEVYFEPDTTDAGETPGSSDNLSQRNLAILHSDNPGGPDSHLVAHTFEVKPSAILALPTYGGGANFTAAVLRRGRPDELLFRWHNLPRDSEVTLHFSDVDTEEIMRLASQRFSPAALTVLDRHTLRLKVADDTWLPLPGGRVHHIPALLTVQLPPGVVYGQSFRISVHQIEGQGRNVIGAFEISIPVSKAPLIIDDEKRTLSVLKHIGTTIPADNRWSPIFKLYLYYLSRKYDALGGDSSTVYPNPDGSGTPYVPLPPREAHRLCHEGWLVSVVLAVVLVLLGFARTPLALALALAVGGVLLAVLIAYWAKRCCGRSRCAVLDYLVLGASAAVFALTVAALAGVGGPPIAYAVLLAAFLIAAFVFLSFVLRCRGACCDDPPDDGCKH